MDIDINLLYEPGYNYRKHPDQQIKNLAKSLETFGQRRTISVWPNGEGKYEVLAGNGITFAARVAGWKSLECTIAPQDWDATQRKAYAAADNQGGAEDDQLMLAQLLEEVNNDGRIELEALGSSKEQLQALLDSLGNQMLGEKPGAGGDEFDTTPPPEATRVKPGDLWQLGKHRLLCGDSTDAGQVTRLMGGEVPLIMVTDPPYGVDYDPEWRNEAAAKGLISFAASREGKVTNDNRVDWTDAYKLFTGKVVYCWHADRHASSVQANLKEAGFELRSQVIWAKPRFVISRGHYHWQHEPCWYAVRKGSDAEWTGDRSQTTLWQIPMRDDTMNSNHGTQKPLGCMQTPIGNHGGEGSIVYDPFLGSGTTLIAAERTNRRCYGIEIEPRYCEVILSRWEAETGQTARLVERIEAQQ